MAFLILAAAKSLARMFFFKKTVEIFLLQLSDMSGMI